MFSGNSKTKKAKPVPKKNINKRDIDARDNEEQKPNKRSKTGKFNVKKWMSIILPNLHYQDPQEFEVNVRYIKKLAAIIAASAERHGIQDEAYIAELIVRLAINNEDFIDDDWRLIPSFPDDASIGYTTQDLRGTVAYFKEYNPDDVLHYFFDHYQKDGPNDSLLVFSEARNQCYNSNQNIERYFVDYLAITKFLYDQQAIFSYLDKLEKAIQKRASYIGENPQVKLVKRADGKFTIPLTAPNIYQRYKLLSSEMMSWGRKNGFKQYTQIIRGLLQEEFSGLLSAHSLLKDSAVSVGNNHGAWSHSLQWYCIIEHQKKTNFLQNKPQKLYASFTSMWNTILDGFNGPTFHSPEFWTDKFLKPDAAERWPLLTGSIVRIHAKMHSPYFDYNDKLRNKYGVEVFTKGFRHRPL